MTGKVKKHLLKETMPGKGKLYLNRYLFKIVASVQPLAIGELPP